ncbi:hypothetical protein D3C76_988450 [compost metagenome]
MSFQIFRFYVAPHLFRTKVLKGGHPFPGHGILHLVSLRWILGLRRIDQVNLRLHVSIIDGIPADLGILQFQFITVQIRFERLFSSYGHGLAVRHIRRNFAAVDRIEEQSAVGVYCNV